MLSESGGAETTASTSEPPTPATRSAAAGSTSSASPSSPTWRARGLVVRDPWMTTAGLAVHMAGKNWFLDRMVWHYQDVTREQATGSATTGRHPAGRDPAA